MKNLLSFKFWFNMRPGPLLSIYQNIFFGLIIFFIVLFLLSWFWKTKKRGSYRLVWQKLYNFALINAFLGIIIKFFNYELVPFLSSRFWFLLWGLGIIIWLYFIYKIWKSIPEKIKKQKQEQEFKKYIP